MSFCAPHAGSTRLQVIHNSVPEGAVMPLAPETHTIAEYVKDDWLDKWIAEGLGRIDPFLANHDAFEKFLNRRKEDT